jgi:hypothetical protein
MWTARSTPIFIAAAILLPLFAGPSEAGDVISLAAKDTLTAVEMDRGDEVRFTLRSGRTVRFSLEGTEAAIVERVAPGGIVYRFSCRVRVDGQPVLLQRFVCSQACFYEPFVVDGLRIWPDIVKKVFDLVPVRYPRKGNLQCVPRKAARFALQDAALRICPQRTQPWLAEDNNFIDVGRCYNGDDCYLGPYLGQACHVGMDINHPKGSPLFAPIDFDTHAYFNSLQLGHNNNRWRGVRRWPNGDVWALQTHHLIRLTQSPGAPLPAGRQYATTAGVHVGSHEHTHFEFKVGRKSAHTPLPAPDDAASIACPIDFDDQSDAAIRNPEVLHLDPWIVFWQIFEDRKSRRGELRACMQPLRPATTGRTVAFSAEGSRSGSSERRLKYTWTFGDTGVSLGPNPSHLFARPGVFPVTLLVDDGRHRATCTQHIVVSGEPVDGPVLSLSSDEEPSFRPRPPGAAETYGRTDRRPPHCLTFVARSSRPVPASKIIRVENAGRTGTLAPATVRVAGGNVAWLNITRFELDGQHLLRVNTDGRNCRPGQYTATVSVDCPGAANSPQYFHVQMRIPDDPPASQVVIDDRDAGFYATPSFWMGHRFCRCPKDRRGHGGFYLTNGGRPAADEFIRFTPDLKAGEYNVMLSDATPFRPGTEFNVRVRHRHGKTMVRMCPQHARRIGTFWFDEGADGYVEIYTKQSKGLVIADAVEFQARS